MVVSPDIPEFFHSDSTSFNARLQPNESGGTPVLVVKSKSDTKKAWPALGVLARGALSLMGRGGAKAAAGKGAQVGVKGAAGTAGAAGGAGAGSKSMREAMDMATDSGAPAAGFGTKTLENTATSAPKQSMTNLDGGSAAVADKTPTPPSEMPGGGAKITDYGGSAGEPKANMGTLKPDTGPVEAKPEMTQTTLKPDDPTLQSAVEESAQRTADREQDKKIGILQDKTKRDRALGAGYVGVSALQNRNRAKDAEQRAEMERIERLAQDGRAKAGTGSKVAVSS